MNNEDRADGFSAAFPRSPPLSATDEWITGTWAIGACYKNKNRLYGAYPYGYLRRVHSMFPDVRSVLHAFSGGMTLSYATEEMSAVVGMRDVSITLVDSRGPEDGRHPTDQHDITDLPSEWAGKYDLVLADPPYSADDAKVYGTDMPKIRDVMTELRRVTKTGGTMVWLDQKWPMHRKAVWKTFAHIGLVRSTNHRMRLVSMFHAV